MPLTITDGPTIDSPNPRLTVGTPARNASSAKIVFWIAVQSCPPYSVGHDAQIIPAPSRRSTHCA